MGVCAFNSKDNKHKMEAEILILIRSYKGMLLEIRKWRSYLIKLSTENQLQFQEIKEDFSFLHDVKLASEKQNKRVESMQSSIRHLQ